MGKFRHAMAKTFQVNFGMVTLLTPKNISVQ